MKGDSCSIITDNEPHTMNHHAMQEVQSQAQFHTILYQIEGFRGKGGRELQKLYYRATQEYTHTELLQ